MVKGHGRGRGGSRGGRGRGGRRGGRCAGPPSGEALAVKATGSAKFISLACSCPFKPSRPSSENANEVVLHMESWKSLDSLLSWFRDATDTDHEAGLCFSPSLTKAQRAHIHTTVNAVGLGTLVTVSNGVGEARNISVVRRGSDAAMTAAERLAACPDDAEEKAVLLWRWAQKEGLEVSRDEALELMTELKTRPLPASLAELWARKWPSQEAAQALCSAVASKDVHKVQAAIEAHPEAVRDAATDERSGISPLHLAAGDGMIEALEALIAAGAPVNACDGGGQTALEIARKFDQSDAEGVLLRAGAVDPAASNWPGEKELPHIGGIHATGDSGDEFGVMGGGMQSGVSVCDTETVANPGDVGSVIEEYQDPEYIDTATGDVLIVDATNSVRTGATASTKAAPAAPAEEERSHLVGLGDAASQSETVSKVDGGAKSSTETTSGLTRRGLSWGGASSRDARDEIDAWIDDCMAWATKHSVSLMAGAGAVAVAVGTVLLWYGKGHRRAWRS